MNIGSDKKKEKEKKYLKGGNISYLSIIFRLSTPSIKILSAKK